MALISEFKAKCIGLLKEVKKTGEPLTVTLRGEPLAGVEPIRDKKMHAKARNVEMADGHEGRHHSLGHGE